MPGVSQTETTVGTVGSPSKKSKLSLRFLHKKETKRALDFSEPQADEPKTEELKEELKEEPEASSCDQVVPGPSPCPASPGLVLSCERRENLMPFVGLNNLGNTCYLNSVLQVLYYCPGLREGIKKLYNLSKRKDKAKEEADKSDQQSDVTAKDLPAQIELLGSFNSLITSVEQLQSSFLLNPNSFTEGELATPPRRLLHTLRRLNPMYEGCLQHDAQEVLQCILGYIQEACDTIRKEQGLEKVDEGDDAAEAQTENDGSETDPKTPTEDDGQVSGKRKSDTEVGNAKKKTKSVKSNKAEAVEGEEKKSGPLTRSKRRSSSEMPAEGTKDKAGDGEGTKGADAEEGGGSDGEGKEDKASKEAGGKRKKRMKLSWLKPSGKQPNIFSKFRSVGKISCSMAKNQVKVETAEQSQNTKTCEESATQNPAADLKAKKHQDSKGLDLMKHMFQGQLVLKTRCLECESFTERREDFQDISVPVLDEQPSGPADLKVSPELKPQLKTLNWAIGQFASVERIAGKDKYFCENCLHYTEAERSLLFDKTPEVITIHLKRFSATCLELDPYAGLSKVNDPLQTPLTLSLEEWCSRSSSSRSQRYQLFAVVMHSGITISSGHYTAYVRMSDLKEPGLCQEAQQQQQGEEEQQEQVEEESKEAPQVKEEALDYDDGEVSFSLNPRRGVGLARAKTAGKKLSEGAVGLLGGQRSASSCELADKATEGSKRRKSSMGSLSQSQSTAARKKKEEEEAADSTEQQAPNHLLEYEGKWLLFDDSEVTLFQEDEFLRACSPKISSASTPYLLFYRRIPEP